MSGEIDRERLAKLLGLFGSDHAGEILAAARHVEKMRRSSGLTWVEILCPAPSRIAALRDAPKDRDDPNDLPALLRRLLEDADAWLSEWEANFLRSLQKRRKRLTPKQAHVLDRIREKCRRSRAA